MNSQKPVLPVWGAVAGSVVIALAFLFAVRQPPQVTGGEHPGIIEVSNDLGVALIVLGRSDEALAYYRKEVETQPQSSLAHNRLATVLLQTEQWQESRLHFEKALECNADSITALRSLAWLHATCPEASIRDGMKAVELAQRARKLSGKDDALVLSTLAAAYAEAGQFKEAVSAAGEALRLARGTKLADTIWSQQMLYRAKKPFRDVREHTGAEK